jgi:hypothetical protein
MASTTVPDHRQKPPEEALVGFLKKVNPVGEAANQRVQTVNRAFTGTQALAANKHGLANTNLLLADMLVEQRRTNELLDRLGAMLAERT